MPADPLEIKLGPLVEHYRALVEFQGERIDPASLIRDHFARGELAQCQGEVFQFELFVKQLGDIRAARPDVFEELKRRMYSCAQPDNYFGLRMEARIASTLCRFGEDFAIQERPDYLIRNGPAFIECGSVWPDTTDPEKDYRDRIVATVRKKGRQRYATLDTALALEGTSVIAAMMNHGRVDDDSDIAARVVPVLAECGFGAVLLLMTVFDPRSGRLMSMHFSFSAPDAAPPLVALLDRCFPLGNGGKSVSPFVPGQADLPGVMSARPKPKPFPK